MDYFSFGKPEWYKNINASQTYDFTTKGPNDFEHDVIEQTRKCIEDIKLEKPDHKN
jgi:hypothetical protein